MFNIDSYKSKIVELCRSRPIIRLGLFGSAMTERFTPQSDVDVLVIFENGEEIDLFDEYFELKEALEKIFNRTVDLVIDKPFKNPFFQKVVDGTRKIIYER